MLSTASSIFRAHFREFFGATAELDRRPVGSRNLVLSAGLKPVGSRSGLVPGHQEQLLGHEAGRFDISDQQPDRAGQAGSREI
jgi:hypothetical protein